MNQTARPSLILLIDSEEEWLKFAQSALSSSGYRVSSSDDASKARNLVRGTAFALILVDWRVVEQESAIFEELTTLGYAKNSRVVVVCPTDLTPTKMRDAFKMGAHDCVDKQYYAEGLVSLVNQQLAEAYISAPTRSQGDDHE